MRACAGPGQPDCQQHPQLPAPGLRADGQSYLCHRLNNGSSMHGNMTVASITAVVALGLMAAAGPAPAQAAQDAPVRVLCNSAALARVVAGAASGATLSLAPGCHYVLTAG